MYIHETKGRPGIVSTHEVHWGIYKYYIGTPHVAVVYTHSEATPCRTIDHMWSFAIALAVPFLKLSSYVLSIIFFPLDKIIGAATAASAAPLPTPLSQGGIFSHNRILERTEIRDTCMMRVALLSNTGSSCIQGNTNLDQESSNSRILYDIDQMWLGKNCLCWIKLCMLVNFLKSFKRFNKCQVTCLLWKNFMSMKFHTVESFLFMGTNIHRLLKFAGLFGCNFMGKWF